MGALTLCTSDQNLSGHCWRLIASECASTPKYFRRKFSDFYSLYSIVAVIPQRDNLRSFEL